LATVLLDHRALGTSGSGTQFFIDRGRRLGHILDPRTGVPAEGVLSATVVAPTAAEADSLSTALYVLGPTGLARVAPPGGAVGAILVVPGVAAGAVRVLTANLDGENAQNIIHLMRDLNTREGTTFVCSTHDHRILKEARRIVTLEDGLISSDERR
jgi:hypothetical protein